MTIGVVSWIGYVSARESLRAASERELMGLQRSKTAMVQNILKSARNEVLSLSASQCHDERRPGTVGGVPAARPRARHPGDAGGGQTFLQRGVRAGADETLGDRSARRQPSADDADGLVPPLPLHRDRAEAVRRETYQPLGHRQERLRAGGRPACCLNYRAPSIGSSRETSPWWTPRPSTCSSVSNSPPFWAPTWSTVPMRRARCRNSCSACAIRRTWTTTEWPISRRITRHLAIRKPLSRTPVFDGPRMIAIMVLRLPIEPISKALSGNRQWEAEGLGKTGEVYLLGPDQTMRNDSRFLIEDRAAFLATLRRSTLTSRTVDTVDKLGTTILTVPVDHEAARAALRGETGVMAIPDYRGIPALMAYGPVDLDSLRWGVIAKIDEAEAMAPLGDYAKRVLTWGVGLSLLATLMALLLAKVLTRPISALVRAAKQVSQGALDVRVEVIATDEYRELGEAFNEMVASLRTNRAELDRQVLENERLLVSLLPASGAAHVRDGNAEARQSFADVTVAYVNLVGFESLSPELGEDDSMALLSDIVAACDEAAEQHGVEKVRTIGSSYLAVSGLSVERPDHTARMVDFAREVVRIVKRFNAERGVRLVAEIGINAGPVIGGLVGRRKFIYDLWGDTVKLARGIESDGKTSILVTRAVYERVRDLVPFGVGDQSRCARHGPVELFSLLDEATA